MAATASWHPIWCSQDACTAYVDPDEVDRRYHRSRPIIIETEDPFFALYIHLGACADGSQPYVEVAELERPLRMPWFEESPTSRGALVVPVDQANALRHALASAVRAGLGGTHRPEFLSTRVTTP